METEFTGARDEAEKERKKAAGWEDVDMMVTSFRHGPTIHVLARELPDPPSDDLLPNGR